MYFIKRFDYPTRIKVGQPCPILNVYYSQKTGTTLKKVLEQM